MWLIRTKLKPPPPTERLIPRQRLRRRLPALLRTRLVLVHAPAGFGKTCLLAEWQRQLVAQRVRVAWLSLHEDDSEPLQFLAYLTAALSAAGVDVGALGQSAERGFPDVPPMSLITALDRSLRRVRRPWRRRSSRPRPQCLGDLTFKPPADVGGVDVCLRHSSICRPQRKGGRMR